MRLVILIMTGIGFTLGLLCGLLLQLPADGLPANSKYNSERDNIGDQGTDHHYDQRDMLSFPSISNDSVLPESRLGSAAQVNDTDNYVDGSRDIRVGKGAEKKQVPQSFFNPVMGQGSRVGGEGTQGGTEGQKTEVSGVNRKGAEDEPAVEGSDEGRRRSQLELTSDRRGGSAPQSRTDGKDLAGGKHPSEAITAFSIRLRHSSGRVVVESAVPLERNGQPLASAERLATPSEIAAAAASDAAANRSTGGSLDGVVSQGVLWSPELEKACPKGFKPDAVSAWKKRSLGMQVVKMEEGCGRMQNRLLTFRDASTACARYRLNTDQIQGEIFSYYLSRLLNITNLPPTALVPVDSLSDKWKTVHLDLSMAQWVDGRVVVLTQWLEGLAPSHIPPELREDNRKLHPTAKVLGRKSAAELCDLVQWSDLVVFDYLTANLDRVVNNMFNRQWNAEMMNNPAHNLERQKDGCLVFLDNESGLFHGYRLLDKYSGYHEALLASLCVFRDSTAKAVKVLHQSKSVGEELKKLFEEGEVHHKSLPVIPEKNTLILQDRLANVYDQIVRCEQLYGR